MSQSIILASGSTIRAELLARAGVSFEVMTARVDEQSIKASLLAEGESPRNVADALAQTKAEKIGARVPGAFTIGCDQVLAFDGQIVSKPARLEEAKRQLQMLAGKQHQLHSAAVIVEGGKTVWRKVSDVTMTMRAISDDYLEAYLARNWPEVSHSCGAYQVEAEGSRLFSRIQGDYFAVLGLPLLEVLDYLALRGAIES
ncbi:septum formation protein Maf [Pseudooceanicola sediminis]|uniref:Nucleoside triphosphate pyrophosphatase n=1 Tax=Pseudooceanicola sediminis TaxID=2211117 RepID=A0A399J4J0_9RHOB|nr:Maf family nucleotide pyrophosphatase [Pseudooceanicola sediminis]KAA2315450.1 septum formation protein Maf [Puniceibacterium sp. HSS470]RII40343.1 septum formation protein Maf [Pseudooceanicola sediminis]|tara:strand:- start:36676 stop:37275 length:600 start_codon:yes stop_codon:yes gene_type:complete